MSGDAKKALLFLGALAAGASALWLYLPRLLHRAAGVEAEIRSVLLAAESRGLSLPVSGSASPLVSSRARFDRLTLTGEGREGAVTAVATLDFDGRVGEVGVSSLGLERVRFTFRDGAWTPEGGLAPRLTAAVGRLLARAEALESGDRERLARLWEEPPPQEELAYLGTRADAPRRWLLRSEREAIVVREELEGAPPRAVRLFLVPREGEFLFSASLR